MFDSAAAQYRKFLKISSMRYITYMLKTHGKPQDAQEPQKRRQGPGPIGRTGPGPGTQAPAAFFVAPEHPEAFHGSSAYKLCISSC